MVAAGLGLAALGLLFWFGGRWLGWFGRLPGDIHIEGARGSFHFPVVTCIVVSVLLSAVMALIRKFSGN